MKNKQQNEREEYWAALRRDAAKVAQLPHSLRGGSAALQQERELDKLDETIAQLRSQLQKAKNQR